MFSNSYMFNIFKKKFIDESPEEQKKDIEIFPRDFIDAAMGGLSCDILPNSTGEFGRSKMNPIPVNGPIGEIKYMNRLRSNDGGLIFHRIGSDDEIDIYETVSTGGKVWDILYFDMYHPRRSTRPPSGYSFSEYKEQFVKLNLGYYTNTFDPEFPFGLSEAIKKNVGGTLGIRIAKKYEEEIEDKSKFVRPLSHFEKLQHIKVNGQLI